MKARFYRAGATFEYHNNNKNNSSSNVKNDGNNNKKSNIINRSDDQIKVRRRNTKELHGTTAKTTTEVRFYSLRPVCIDNLTTESSCVVMSKSKRFSLSHLFQRRSSTKSTPNSTNSLPTRKHTRKTSLQQTHCTNSLPTTASKKGLDKVKQSKREQKHDHNDDFELNEPNNNEESLKSTCHHTVHTHHTVHHRRHKSEADIHKLQTSQKKYSFFLQMIFSKHSPSNKKQQHQKTNKNEHPSTSTSKSTDASSSSASASSSCYDDESDSLHPHAMMFYAVRYKDFDLLEYLITNNTDIKIDDLNEDGIAVIHFAAMIGSTECISILSKFGADLNTEDIRGNPPLHYAILMKKYEFAGVLLEKGASANLLTKQQFPELKMKSKRMSWFT